MKIVEIEYENNECLICKNCIDPPKCWKCGSETYLLNKLNEKRKFHDLQTSYNNLLCCLNHLPEIYKQFILKCHQNLDNMHEEFMDKGEMPNEEDFKKELIKRIESAAHEIKKDFSLDSDCFK